MRRHLNGRYNDLFIKQIVTGTIDITGVNLNASATLTAPVVSDNTLLAWGGFFSNDVGTPGGETGEDSGYYTLSADGKTVTAFRGEQVNTSTLRVAYNLIEFQPGIVMRSGRGTGGVSGVIVNFSPAVPPTRTLLGLTGWTTAAVGVQGQEGVYLSLSADGKTLSTVGATAQVVGYSWVVLR